jgi:threonine aldolase
MAKGRFLGQQFARFFHHDQLWLELGKKSVESGRLLADGLHSKGTNFYQEPVTNQIFVIWPKKKIVALQKDFGFYAYMPYDNEHDVARLVCSWATPESAIDEFVEAV